MSSKFFQIEQDGIHVAFYKHRENDGADAHMQRIVDAARVATIVIYECRFGSFAHRREVHRHIVTIANSSTAGQGASRRRSDGLG